jgi:hypothetical protein
MQYTVSGNRISFTTTELRDYAISQLDIPAERPTLFFQLGNGQTFLFLLDSSNLTVAETQLNALAAPVEQAPAVVKLTPPIEVPVDPAQAFTYQTSQTPEQVRTARVQAQQGSDFSGLAGVSPFDRD